MKASEFMSKIDKKQIEFESVFSSGTFGWEFDFAEAYSNHQNKELIEENKGLKETIKVLNPKWYKLSKPIK